MTMYPATDDNAFNPARKSFENLIERLKTSDSMTLDHDEVEELVAKDAREVLRLLVQGHLALRTGRDRGRPAPLGADGEERTHRRDTSRPLKTIFGPVEVRRLTFTSKAAAGGLRPLDVELNLPEQLYSMSLGRLAADFAMDMSFETAMAKVETTTGTAIPKRQFEELTARAAIDYFDFYDERQELISEKQEHVGSARLQVLTSDGKGIVMRPEALREATRRKAEREGKRLATRLSPGEKRNRKRMAEVAAVYELEPQPRTPADILPLPGEDPPEGRPPARPRPENKRVWASVDKSLKDIVQECFDEALSRDGWVERQWVYLVDGNRDQIRAARRIASGIGLDLIIIIDFIHVLEYLWKAAWCFHDKGDTDVEKWVLERARAVLEGKASSVAAGIRRSATLRELTLRQRTGADACADYLLNKKDMLRYDIYLAQGMPIATGVIEGACRHLVNDRLGITGSRWGLDGAEAILRLRALRASGDFDDYWRFHRRRELERNHLVHYANTEFAELREAA